MKVSFGIENIDPTPKLMLSKIFEHGVSTASVLIILTALSWFEQIFEVGVYQLLWLIVSEGKSKISFLK